MARIFTYSHFSLAAVCVLAVSMSFCLVYQTRSAFSLALRWCVDVAFPASATAGRLIERFRGVTLRAKRSPTYARASAFAGRQMERTAVRRHGAALNVGIASASLA